MLILLKNSCSAILLLLTFFKLDLKFKFLNCHENVNKISFDVTMPQNSSI